MARKRFPLAVLGGAALAAAYFLKIRPWHLRWGATPEEVYAVLPGDALVPNPRINATHAIDIAAPPEAVWPWLAQLGQGRGGFYTYTWLENLMGLDMHNADRILPEHQQIAAGDTIPLTPDGFGVPVALAEPARTLVLHGDTRVPGQNPVPTTNPADFANVLWGFHLFPRPDGTTRLVERWLADYRPGPLTSLLYRLVLEPGAFILQRGMLLGIKRRAERGG